MGNIFNNDFREFIQALNLHNVDYILVGGYAVILHGYPRTTGDLDIWINNTRDNYIKMKKAFDFFGLPINAIHEFEFLNNNEKEVYTFGRPPVSIDILTKVKGLTFEECYKLATWDNSQGFEIRLIYYNHLIEAKQAAHRFKDLNDIEHLRKKL